METKLALFTILILVDTDEKDYNDRTYIDCIYHFSDNID